MGFSRQKAAQIADRLQCDVAAVLAVAEVESGGRKDLPDGRPQILFEAHWFSRLTRGVYDRTHPAISSPTWNRALYRGGAAEYDRLDEARALDETAALQSASWGAFQIMGFNHRACGFRTVQGFVKAIQGPDDNDMEAFMAFVHSNPAMHLALRANDWTTFARLYNGPGAVASYSGRIADAYRRHVGGRIADLGPPLPYADPTMPARSPISSRTVIAGGVAGVSTLGAIADQASMMSQLAGSAASAGYSMSALLRTFGPAILLGVVALGAVGYIVWRYIAKMRAGDVVSR